MTFTDFYWSLLAWADPLRRVRLAYWFWLLVLVQPEVPESSVSGWIVVILRVVFCSRRSSFQRRCSSPGTVGRAESAVDEVLLEYYCSECVVILQQRERSQSFRLYSGSCPAHPVEKGGKEGGRGR